MESRLNAGTRRASIPTSAVVVAIAAGIVGYVGGLMTPRPPTTTASAAPTLVAISAPPTSLGTEAPSMAPPKVAATGSPRSPWQRTEFFANEDFQVDGIWGLQDRVIGVGSFFGDRWSVTLLSGSTWLLSSAPSAIGRLWGGTVVDDRLWFLAYVTGMRRSEIRLRLVGTDGDENAAWKALGPSDLDPDAPIRFLEKIADTWITAQIGPGGNIETGSPQYLRWSKDGVQWARAHVPSLRGVDPSDVAFNGAAATRDFVVVHANVERAGVSNDVLLVSEDGVAWREVPAPAQVDWHADLACGDTACVLTPYAWEEEALPYPLPIAWMSTDGLSWKAAETTLADESSGPGIGYVVPAADGFVGVEGGTSNGAWVSSPDALTWRRLEPLPMNLSVPIVGLAVSGDTVIALEQGPDVESQGAWVGSLAALRNGD